MKACGESGSRGQDALDSWTVPNYQHKAAFHRLLGVGDATVGGGYWCKDTGLPLRVGSGFCFLNVEAADTPASPDHSLPEYRSRLPWRCLRPVPVRLLPRYPFTGPLCLRPPLRSPSRLSCHVLLTQLGYGQVRNGSRSILAHRPDRAPCPCLIFTVLARLRCPWRLPARHAAA